MIEYKENGERTLGFFWGYIFEPNRGRAQLISGFPFWTAVDLQFSKIGASVLVANQRHG